jgi:hypothetical protein
VSVSLGSTDKTRIHGVGPRGISTAKKARSQNESEKLMDLSGKLMVTMFWDMQGILLIEYMKKGSTITGEVYKD